MEIREEAEWLRKREDPQRTDRGNIRHRLEDIIIYGYTRGKNQHGYTLLPVLHNECGVFCLRGAKTVGNQKPIALVFGRYF